MLSSSNFVHGNPPTIGIGDSSPFKVCTRPVLPPCLAADS